ncbi:MULTISPECIES: hypothetical protein [Streptomyces]|uniref:hypothetical protein n=1 Tax=Streptomyces TaxID=1883 RepID=UPI0004BD5100|nr:MULTISPECIES: hypothetical protein [Streptomyces]KJY16705.1 hypothetical protein VR43_33155 [Streptomyces sp. NRRL S-104]KOU30374.1 hypothetical protein ADK53_28395 [Streptomyces sp. WM6373]KOU61560.1 hypothetical protein ADK96_28200 [Streptomyces sp. IGB124]KOU71389.1 hypothetical protein ADK61_30870 [Streptomyces sp. XY66]KOU82654.1 hypothetical protein ADK93_28650 [Streptomyces sp. XY58]
MVLTPTERIRAVEEAVRELKEALDGVGVVFPSLDVERVSAAGTYGLPLVDLGRCNLDTALRLAAVLHERAHP